MYVWRSVRVCEVCVRLHPEMQRCVPCALILKEMQSAQSFLCCACVCVRVCEVCVRFCPPPTLVNNRARRFA